MVIASKFKIPHTTGHRFVWATAALISSSQLASARKFLCRGLRSRRLPERFHCNALVPHFQHGQLLRTARPMKHDTVTRRRLHQRAPQRGHPTDVVAVEIDLVCAYDAHDSFRSSGIGIAHGRSKKCSCRRLARSRSFRVHHFRGFDSLAQKANPPIDLPQPPLAVPIVGIVAAIAIAGSPRHHLRHRRAFPGEQKAVLILEALKPARRYVVLDGRRGLVGWWLSRRTFPHLVILLLPVTDGCRVAHSSPAL